MCAAAYKVAAVDSIDVKLTRKVTITSTTPDSAR